MSRALKMSEHDMVTSPVLVSQTLPWTVPVADEFDALIVTSQIAVDVLAATNMARSLLVYAVGGATADAARGAGFAQVIDGGGTAETLLRVVDAASFRSGLYLSARQVSRDLARDRPWRITRRCVYDMVPASSLSPEITDFLASGQDIVVPFYSPRSFQIFEALVTKHGLTDHLSRAIAVAIHPRVFRTQSLLWEQTCSAETPDGSGMIEAIRRAA